MSHAFEIVFPDDWSVTQIDKALSHISRLGVKMFGINGWYPINRNRFYFGSRGDMIKFWDFLSTKD